MSNGWTAYQEATTTAKKFGGMEQYLKHVERGAVAKSAPVFLLAGVAVGIGVMKLRAKLIAKGEEAKDQLRLQQ